jgi:hypothetical protein
MPFSMVTYMGHVMTANPQFKRIKDSSLDPLNLLLQNAPQALPAPLRQQVTETLGLIPFAKQQKYAAALNYARQNLNLGIPGIPYGYPVDLVHRFDSYEAGAAQWNNGQDSRPDGWFKHIFDITWTSSNGNMGSLANVWNQERVTFLQPAGGAPFRNAVMGQTPQTYTMGINHSSSGGNCQDNHYFMHPSLMLAYPIAPRIVPANQEYEYSPDNGQTWYVIPRGHFIFDRGVRQAAAGGGGLVFVFSKRNRVPQNNRAYHFEVEYPIGPAPTNLPGQYNDVWGKNLCQGMALNTYATVIAQA